MDDNETAFVVLILIVSAVAIAAIILTRYGVITGAIV